MLASALPPCSDMQQDMHVDMARRPSNCTDTDTDNMHPHLWSMRDGIVILFDCPRGGLAGPHRRQVLQQQPAKERARLLLEEDLSRALQCILPNSLGHGLAGPHFRQVLQQQPAPAKATLCLRRCVDCMSLQYIWRRHYLLVLLAGAAEGNLQ